MNDRYKFRAWDKTENTYIEDAQFTYDDGCEGGMGSFRHYSFRDLLEDKNCIVEQCTGLKDKNGKLIYEGDWLKTKDGYYCYVVWFKGFWWVKSLPSEAMDLEHAEFYKECEVVGNIHENADLIKVGGK